MGLLERKTMEVLHEMNPQAISISLWSYATLGRSPPNTVMGALETRALEVAHVFKAQNVSNTLWAYGTMGRRPPERLIVALENRAVETAADFSPQTVANLLWAYATLGRTPPERVMCVLETRAEATANDFKAQELSNTLWAFATVGKMPPKSMMCALETRAAQSVNDFKAQNVANVLWAYAAMGSTPPERVMTALEKRAAETVHVFNVQDVANTLWSLIVLRSLRHDFSLNLVSPLFMRLFDVWTEDLSRKDLSQMHQVLVTCHVDRDFQAGLSASILEQLRPLTAACKRAFGTSYVSPSKTQQTVSSTLRAMGWIVEDEVQCPRSGYSIDMLVRKGAEDTGGGCWAVEFDGPVHFLRGSGNPTGATLIKRRHLELLGYKLVSISHLQWDRLPERSRREYLASRLQDHCHPQLLSSSHHSPLGGMGYGADAMISPAHQRPAEQEAWAPVSVDGSVHTPQDYSVTAHYSPETHDAPGARTHGGRERMLADVQWQRLVQAEFVPIGATSQHVR